MKHKMVIKFSMNGDKSRTKALKTAVGLHGVESASLGEKDKSQLEVIGEVDPVKLMNSLRKKFAGRPHLPTCVSRERSLRYVELISVTVVGEKKDDKKDDQYPPIVQNWSMLPPGFVLQEPSPCSIL